jgi:hypothetical protein
LEIHDMLWNVDSDVIIDPPIHTEYLRSGTRATILTLTLAGASAVIFLDMHSDSMLVQNVGEDRKVIVEAIVADLVSRGWLALELAKEAMHRGAELPPLRDGL